MGEEEGPVLGAVVVDGDLEGAEELLVVRAHLEPLLVISCETAQSLERFLFELPGGSEGESRLKHQGHFVAFSPDPGQTLLHLGRAGNSLLDALLEISNQTGKIVFGFHRQLPRATPGSLFDCFPRKARRSSSRNTHPFQRS